jgi:hypothetical protein
MIVYRDSRKLSGPTCPEWLSEWKPGSAGVHSLCHRDTADGHLVGVGDPLLFSPPRRWFDVDQDWQAGSIGKDLNHGVLARDLLWCESRACADLADRVWMAPVILTAGGDRAFRVAYGSNWLPSLTPEQTRAEKVAVAAREALLSGGADMAIACQWAAELLCVTYHLHVQVIAGLALLDDRLVPEVLATAAGINLEMGVDHGNP